MHHLNINVELLLKAIFDKLHNQIWGEFPLKEFHQKVNFK